MSHLRSRHMHAGFGRCGNSFVRIAASPARRTYFHASVRRLGESRVRSRHLHAGFGRWGVSRDTFVPSAASFK